MEHFDIRFGFLSYLTRSGSTLLSRLLNEYADICVTLEGDLPTELFCAKRRKPLKFENIGSVNKYLKIIYRYTKLNTWCLDEKELLEKFEILRWPIYSTDLAKILMACYKDIYKPNASIVIYKGPPIMPWEIPNVAKYYNGAKFIKLVRDPRAIYNSQKTTLHPYKQKPFADSPLEVAFDWKRSETMDFGPSSDRIFEVTYENLLIETESTLDNILYFLKVGNSKNKLFSQRNFSEIIPQQEKQIHSLVSEKPDISRINNWQKTLSTVEISMIELMLFKLMKARGYTPSVDHYTMGLKMRMIYISTIFTVKLHQFVKRSLRIFCGPLKHRKLYTIKLKSILGK